MDKKIETTSLKTDVLLGKDLTEEVIQMMDNQRIKEYGENTKDFRNNEGESTFFFLKDGNKVKAFGMLKPITLYYDDKPYQIMGFANVIAIEKSKGFGCVLMGQITKYLEENNIVAIGNTFVDNFEFYKKCGYTFVPGLLPRFVYKKANDEEERTETENYEMFVYDSHNVLKDVIEGNNPIVIRVPFW